MAMIPSDGASMPVGSIVTRTGVGLVYRRSFAPNNFRQHPDAWVAQ